MSTKKEKSTIEVKPPNVRKMVSYNVSMLKTVYSNYKDGASKRWVQGMVRRYYFDILLLDLTDYEIEYVFNHITPRMFDVFESFIHKTQVRIATLHEHMMIRLEHHLSDR